MTYEEIMQKPEELGSEQTKQIYKNHGVMEPYFGVDHEERNRVRYVMNGFVMSLDAYVTELNEEAKQVAEYIGKVHVDVGNTACKVPLA